MFTYFYFAAAMGLVIAMIAQHKGAGAGLWLLYGFLLWPVALVHVLLRKRVDVEPAPKTMPTPLGGDLP